jgi:hypothetical protein
VRSLETGNEFTLTAIIFLQPASSALILHEGFVFWGKLAQDM